MEAGTAPVAASGGTGSKTMADLGLLAARKFGDTPALMHKVGDEWNRVSYTDFGKAIAQTGLGLIDLGIEPGDKVAILSNSRPEWVYANFAILASGAASVAIYQTNSPEECHYVLSHSEAKAVFVEDESQLAKIREVEKDLPELEHIVIFDAAGADTGDALTLDELRERGAARDESELEQRSGAVTGTDPCLYIYTSGTTGPPKACITSHSNYREVTSMTNSRDVVTAGEVVYLFLPLAHSFAQLVAFTAADIGATIAFWEKDPQKIIPNLMEVKPTYFPSVPRIFEKIYTLANANAEDPEQLKQAIQIGLEVRQRREKGEPVPPDMQQAFDAAEEKLFVNVRNLFGGRIRQAVTGAAPIAGEILEFFYACGIPVMEGYGMTETSTVATVNTPEEHRFGSVGKALPGVEVKIADDGEVVIKGPNIFQGYYKNDEATREALEDGWLHTGDLGRVDEDGFLFITGRKKDIIITAGGKNITPANLENGLKQNRWISQAVVIGDKRPYLIALVTLDPEEAVGFAAEHDTPVEELPESEAMRAEVQKAVDEVNSHVGRVEQIKKFKILPHDFSQETGEMTPSLKVKRNVVNDKYADVVDEVYRSA
ncbi:MAG: long-chain acyl-CoA synthetase [Solirubrobacteraceae bacterium]|nr:long-chain acyl-CoA synthetase [Solirubrobacteraceae bacterium]